MSRRLSVQFIKYHPRLDTDGLAGGVNCMHMTAVAGKVEHHCVADRLPGQRCSPTAWQDRKPMLRAIRNDLLDVLDVSWDHHADRLDLVDARIGGVEKAVVATESHLAVNKCGQVLGDLPSPQRITHRCASG